MATQNVNWEHAVAAIDYAFEPIVNAHTGVAFGFECLLRNYNRAGFPSIQAFFDAAYQDGVLYKVDLMLRDHAIAKFVRSGLAESTKLFYNVDNRILEMADYTQGNTADILAKYDLTPRSLCFELSERHEFKSIGEAMQILKRSKAQSYNIAIDDFGTGFSGFQLLYNSEPDFIKIDRFFISDIFTDNRKRLFVSNIVGIAHLLGIMVIAEGIESEKEFYVCRDIGCDFVQGYYVHAPTQDITKMLTRYEVIEMLIRKDRRKHGSDQRIINDQIEYLPPVSVDADMDKVFETFRENSNCSLFPVVTEDNRPIGIIKEADLKEYAYSPFGRDLLRNKTSGKTLKDFVARCPVADIHTSAEKILEIFSLDENSEGIFIVDETNYVGFLSAKSLLKVLNEKNLIYARDQNPLTKLSGNNVIHSYVSKALDNPDSTDILVYFDLDNFKPFNDTYGFREGDRVILLFSDILRKHLLGQNRFIGHVGGDDFFAAFTETEFEAALKQVEAIIAQFKREAESLYSPEDRAKGYIISKDREGNEKRFNLLTVSAAVLLIPARREHLSMEEMGTVLAQMKKAAKQMEGKACAATMYGKALPVESSVENVSAETIIVKTGAVEIASAENAPSPKSNRESVPMNSPLNVNAASQPRNTSPAT
ncbi:MAG: EAL domain-containing protein [Rhizobacter sp.]|nr:EAL domain-containing protein [Chlorobiales bacterium]